MNHWVIYFNLTDVKKKTKQSCEFAQYRKYTRKDNPNCDYSSQKINHEHPKKEKETRDKNKHQVPAI